MFVSSNDALASEKFHKDLLMATKCIRVIDSTIHQHLNIRLHKSNTQKKTNKYVLRYNIWDIRPW